MDVNVAIDGMTETSDGKGVLFLELGGKTEEVFESAARHDNVLVEFGQSSIAQGIGVLAADFPNLFALPIAKTALKRERLLTTNDFFESTHLRPHGSLLAVQFNNELGAASAQARVFGAVVSRG